MLNTNSSLKQYKSTKFFGSLLALSSCLVWSTSFALPYFLLTFEDILIVMARYSIYGLLSTCILLIKQRSFLKKISSHIWAMSFLWALLSNLLHYIGVIISIRYATAPVTMVIIASTPIFVLIYANIKAKSLSIKSLLILSLLMSSGIILVNNAAIDWSFSSNSYLSYIIGLLGSLLSVVCTGLFVVYNEEFMKKHPEISSQQWSCLIGMSTFVLCFLTLILGYTFNFIDFSIFANVSRKELTKFIMITSLLGLGSSSLGTYLWIKASTLISSLLLGALLIFETIFGLVLFFICKQELPSSTQFFGISLMLSSCLYGFYALRKPIIKHQTEKVL